MSEGKPTASGVKPSASEGKPSASEPDQPNARQRVDITADDLPLHCPMPGKRLWDSHPRVYLPIENGGEQTCPYCGTRYVFAGAAGSAG